MRCRQAARARTFTSSRSPADSAPDVSGLSATKTERRRIEIIPPSGAAMKRASNAVASSNQVSRNRAAQVTSRTEEEERRGNEEREREEKGRMAMKGQGERGREGKGRSEFNNEDGKERRKVEQQEEDDRRWEGQQGEAEQQQQQQQQQEEQEEEAVFFSQQSPSRLNQNPPSPHPPRSEETPSNAKKQDVSLACSLLVLGDPCQTDEGRELDTRHQELVQHGDCKLRVQGRPERGGGSDLLPSFGDDALAAKIEAMLERNKHLLTQSVLKPRGWQVR
eukprot:767663-Hanusia_phi.AAC.2